MSSVGPEGEIHMKRILAVVFFVLGLILTAAPCAVAQWGWGVAIGSGMQQQMEVRNNSGFYCEITAANARIAVLAPGERIIDPRKYQGSREEMPVWAVCYKDGSLRQYVGFTAAIFHLLFEQPSSNCWTIRNDMLRGPDGDIADTSNVPSLIPSATFTKVKIPGKNLVNGTFLNIFNNSPFPVIIEIEGRSEGVLPPGKLYLGWVTGGYYPTPLHIIATAMDESTTPAKNAGTWTTQIIPQSSSAMNSVTNQVFWLESKDFR